MSAVLDEAAGFAATDVEAVLNYTRENGIRPVNYTFDPPPGVPRSSGEIDARTVKIHDARKVPGLSLDVSGFEVISHRGTLRDWASFQNAERVKAIDYPEVAAALKNHTGADKVLIFDHTLRDSTAVPGRQELREPVRRVHDDQTFDSAPRRVARHLEPAEAAWGRPPVCDREFLAAGRGNCAAVAARGVRRTHDRAAGPLAERSQISRLDRGDLLDRI
jgi:hypothetical protein